MKVGVIIPDRGDRPEFTANCLRMLKGQSLQPAIIEHVYFPAFSNKTDITLRYRTGYDRLRDKGLDVIAFIENDDWYHPLYLETMCRHWEAVGRPELFGTNHTRYYHIGILRHFLMHHRTMSVAMSTFIRPDLNFAWCPDHEPFTDSHLWLVSNLKKVIIDPPIPLCIGIKHGVGKCGGRSHRDRFKNYTEDDPDFSWLKTVMASDPEGIEFYTSPIMNALLNEQGIVKLQRSDLRE